MCVSVLINKILKTETEMSLNASRPTLLLQINFQGITEDVIHGTNEPKREKGVKWPSLRGTGASSQASTGRDCTGSRGPEPPDESDAWRTLGGGCFHRSATLSDASC